MGGQSLDQSRIEAKLYRSPIICIAINETHAKPKPVIQHVDPGEQAPKYILEGSPADHLKALGYTKSGPSGDEIRYRSFLLQKLAETA
jgi:hypothetical protein